MNTKSFENLNIKNDKPMKEPKPLEGLSYDIDSKLLMTIDLQYINISIIMPIRYYNLPIDNINDNSIIVVKCILPLYTK